MEGEVGRRVVRSGIAPSVAAAELEVASRTDRGVSAVGNALALTSSFAPNALLRALNGTAPDVAFTAARAVPESFRVRAAARRVYRYFEPAESHNFREWQATARGFSGPIDVRSFGRAIPSSAPVWRTVESVTVSPMPGGAVVEIRAPSFVWGMVRKIVAALREVEAGRISSGRLDAALHGRARLTLPMAEPERLVLWDVEYALPWEHRWAGPNRHQSDWEESAQDALWVRQKLLDVFSTGRPPRPE